MEYGGATITGLAPGSYMVTVTDDNGVSGSAGCIAEDTVMVGQMDIMLTVMTSSTNSICTADNGTASVVGVDTLSGLTYAWSNGGAGINITNLAPGSYTVTATDGNGCTGEGATVVGQDDTNPTVMFTAPADLCVDAGVQAGLGGGSPSGTDGATGVYSGDGVTDDGNGITYSFDPAVAGVGVHTLTYDYTDQFGCTNSASDDIEVFAIPDAMFTAPADLCINAGVQTGLGGGSPTGGIYSGAGVTDSGDGMTYSFDPAMAGVGTHTITYSVGVSGCTDMAMDDIEVFALPVVTLNIPADQDEFCINDATVLISLAGSPTSVGVYSGPGVADIGNAGISFTFNPAMAGVGTHTVTYTFTDGNGCVNTATDQIVVNPIPNVEVTSTDAICTASNGTATASVTDPIGVITYAWSTGATTATITGLAPGSYMVTVTDDNGVSGSAGCIAEDTVMVGQMDIMLTVMTSSTNSICTADNGTASVVGVDTLSGLTYAWSNGGAGINITNLAPGSYTVTATDGNGCTGEGTTVVGQDDTNPTVMFTAPADLCIDAGVQAGLGGGSPSGTDGATGVYSGDGVTDDGNGTTYSFDPAVAGVGVHTLTYDYTDQFGCTNSASDDIEVFALPIVTFTAPAPDVCIEDPAETGLGGGMPTGGVYSGTGVTDDGNGMTFSFDPTASAPNGGDVLVTYTFTDANGCSASASDDIFVNPICCVPPTIACPANNLDLPMGCNPTVPAGTTMFNVAGGNMPNPAWPTVTEGCEPLILTFNDAMVDVGCMRTVTRTYRITDDNGDFAECDQTFTFTVDNDPPVLSEMPASTTVECDAIPVAPIITATDNCPSIEQVIFINELHYDNAGTDEGEFLEIAGTAGLDLSNYEVYAYEAFDGQFDAQVQLSGIIPNEGAGFGAVAFTRTELPTGFFENGSADAIALVEIATGEVIKFISYEGTATATNGPASGMTSTDIGVAEGGGTMPGESLQLEGMNGCPCTDFTWTGPTVASPGLINSGQSFDITACPSTSDVLVTFTETSTPGTCPQEQVITRTWMATDNCGNPVMYTQMITVEDTTAPEFCDAPIDITVDCEAPMAEYVGAIDNCDFGGLGTAVWINEFHYDNAGGDEGEFIEIAGVAGTSLDGYQLVTYNGANGLVDDVYDLDGIIDNETCNRGALSFLTPGLQNGSPDGFALVQNGTVLEFLSYEGSFTAANGVAMGMTSTDVGVSETGTTPVGQSLQLMGTASNGAGFSWTAPSTASPGSLNTDQSVQGNLEGILTEVDNTTVCDGGTVTRTWNVEDACGNMAMPHVQVITVNAPAAPEIVCPVNMTVECAADIVVSADNAMVTVFCDLGSTTTVTGPVQNGKPDCPGTTYTYTYMVTDDCGRTASCEQVFTIENLAPIIVCPADEVVTCFEDIVADPANLTVTTSCGLGFTAYVKQPLITGGIPGCDGTVYTYIYKVVDDCGRVSQCEQQFIIENNAPTVTVPAGGTVNCASEIEISESDATVTSDCAGDFALNVLGPVINGPANCPGTTYTYTYRVKDFCNRIVETERIFTIGNNGGPIITAIPLNFNSECEVGPSLDQFKAESSCGDGVETSVSDPTVIGTPGCSGTRLQYTYTATDACGRTASHVQIITIQNDGPVIECPETLQIFNCEDGDKDALIEAWIASVTATSACGGSLDVRDNYNGNAGMCINNGFTNVTFFATDQCGRTTTCVGTIIITDTEAPIIYQAPTDVLVPCNGVTQDRFNEWLSTQGGAEAIDGCWGDNISWSTNPSNPQLNCAGGPQAIVVEFIARDGCGNTSSVTGIFNTKVQPDFVNVSGQIMREDAEPVADVQMEITGGSAGIPDMDYTEVSGSYGFPELEYEDNLRLVPEKNTDPLNGLTTYDLILLQRHILGNAKLDSPYKLIAADINRSGHISTFDMIHLRRMILFVDENFQSNTSWRFVEAAYAFPNEANPFETAFPEVYNLSGATEEAADFVGVKIGDLNLDAIANELMEEADDRTSLESLSFRVKDQGIAAGATHQVDFTAENFSNINGFQFTLNLDRAVDLVEVKAGDLINFGTENYGLSKLENGAITVSWNENSLVNLDPQTVVFSVVLSAKQAVELSKVLSISSEYTRAEAYQSNELMNVELLFEQDNELVVVNEFTLFQNQPNPFKSATMIGFNLPASGNVAFAVYDVSGRLIYSERGTYTEGYNQISVDRSSLPASGIFYYHVTTDTDSASKKMILLD